MSLSAARIRWPVAAAIVLAAAGSACGGSNNLLLGRVQAVVGRHTVVVTDCYRTSVPPPEQVDSETYRFTPCRDADVLIHREDLSVNGRAYGHLGAGAAVLVDHGVVSTSGSRRHE